MLAEPVARSFDLDDDGVMEESIEQRRGDDRVAEDVAPFGEAAVGGKDHRKGITGGFLPMGATLATRRLYEAFWSEDRGRMFFHSSSYTGNPIACAAALANLEIWESEPVLRRIGAIAARHAERLPAFRSRDDVADVRQCGSIAALEVRAPQVG